VDLEDLFRVEDAISHSIECVAGIKDRQRVYESRSSYAAS
jgi:hypothetical protein